MTKVIAARPQEVEHNDQWPWSGRAGGSTHGKHEHDHLTLTSVKLPRTQCRTIVLQTAGDL
jgi:hypothetical protein